jgi:diguanylate cyclase (GGDEF)-like protein
VVVQSLAILRLRRRALRAERRFEALQQIAPTLTTAAAESTAACCARIIDRIAALVNVQSLLCFYVDGPHMLLGAKSATGYATFLREGEAYDGETIADWVRKEGRPAMIGPLACGLPRELGVYDLAGQTGLSAGPVAGSRDVAWGLAVPLLHPTAGGERMSVIGVVYADRPRAQPFSEDDVTTLLTISQLAGDALARALFADRVKRELVRDPLTGLMTPSAFRKRLRDEVDARRNESNEQVSRDVALCFIDTDRFKEWNDSFGHASGDQLLRHLAGTFAQMAEQAHGFAGRNGGDEFCIALLDRSKDASIAIARELCTRVATADFAALAAGRLGVQITVSVGVAHFPTDVSKDDRQPTERLLEAADQQMYEAKRAGRDQVAFARARLRA